MKANAELKASNKQDINLFAWVTCDNTDYNHLINLLLFIKGSSKECIKAPKSKDTMPDVFITLRIVSLVSNLWMNAHFWTCAYILTIMSTDKPVLFPLLSLSDPRLPFVMQFAAWVLCGCIIVFVCVCACVCVSVCFRQTTACHVRHWGE